jgi:hypothetical protein
MQHPENRKLLSFLSYRFNNVAEECSWWKICLILVGTHPVTDDS